ncbi:alpha/beta fold hydrolase [Azohydromonas sediminis]|uniref:alpha/beta fold hydrolase n=1 Tax=Azohydromonas sediminis TaxID=2259674 RepID=UPI000E64767E|nr:alpha/beta hydrolase [Azohydromonas sediminis]
MTAASSFASSPPAVYTPRRPGVSRRVPVRGLDYHVTVWGEPDPTQPPLVLVHGWMDVGASFQFVVDALHEVEGVERHVIAPDWRGYGGTVSPPVDSYWFPDYLGDLDALLDALAPARAVDLVGHSMGGNVAMLYAGVRPQRVRRLVNLEGFGMPATTPAQAPGRYAKWLDELKTPVELRSYDDLAAVAARLLKNNPRLTPDKAAWLAPHWAERRADGRWHLRADPAHKRINPILYRVDEVLEVWRRIEAPVLWVDGDLTDTTAWWGHRYPRDEFEARLAVVPRLERHRLSPCGHMLHHDQPLALARRLAAFLA